MAKVLQKYFIAIVPEGKLQEEATGLKLELRDQFNLKYALRSPAHVTLKMPFLWNETREDRLISQLDVFFQDQSVFYLWFKGIGKFGNRVIFVKVMEQKQLTRLQEELADFCKKELNLIQELSDSAYHPHMTLAFRDIKKPLFSDYLEFLSAKGFSGWMEVSQVALLKRDKGRWNVLHFSTLFSPG